MVLLIGRPARGRGIARGEGGKGARENRGTERVVLATAARPYRAARQGRPPSFRVGNRWCAEASSRLGSEARGGDSCHGGSEPRPPRVSRRGHFDPHPAR